MFKKIMLTVLGLFIIGCTDGDTLHIKDIDIKTTTGNIKLICINGIEYIEDGYEFGSRSSLSLVLSVDKNGKPKECNY